MAGIGSVKQLFDKGFFKAQVKAIGTFVEDDGKQVNYCILNLYKNNQPDHYITQFTYKGGDVQFNEKVNKGDYLQLFILDDYSAEWKKSQTL